MRKRTPELYRIAEAARAAYKGKPLAGALGLPSVLPSAAVLNFLSTFSPNSVIGLLEERDLRCREALRECFRAEAAEIQTAELQAEVDRLRSAVLELGEQSDTCVSSYLKERCSYCQCGADAQGNRPAKGSSQ